MELKSLKGGKSMNGLRVLIFLLVLGGVLACNSSRKMMRDAWETNDLPLLEKLAREAIQKNPQNAYAHFMLGRVYRATGEIDSALVYYARAVRLAPQNDTCLKEWREVRLAKGDRLLKAKSPFRASKIFTELVKEDSSYFDAWQRRGLAYRALGWYDSAKVCYERALSLQPLADSLQKVLDFLDAAHVQSNLLTVKGKDLLKKKRYKRAMETLKQALEAKPDNQEAKYYYHLASGLYFYKRGGVKRLWDAIDHFGRASTLRPDEPEPRYYMAEAYLKKDDKDFENTIQAFEEVIRVAPGSSWAKKARKRIAELKKREKLLRDFWGKKK